MGGNTNQKGDGHVGGELLLCEPGKTPQKKISVKDKHYTVLAPTALTGEVIMCCIIFTGTRPQVLYETGLDLSAESIGSVSDSEFFEKKQWSRKKVQLVISAERTYLAFVDGVKKVVSLLRS